MHTIRHQFDNCSWTLPAGPMWHLRDDPRIHWTWTRLRSFHQHCKLIICMQTGLRVLVFFSLLKTGEVQYFKPCQTRISRMRYLIIPSLAIILFSLFYACLSEKCVSVRKCWGNAFFFKPHKKEPTSGHFSSLRGPSVWSIYWSNQNKLFFMCENLLFHSPQEEWLSRLSPFSQRENKNNTPWFCADETKSKTYPSISLSIKVWTSATHPHPKRTIQQRSRVWRCSINLPFLIASQLCLSNFLRFSSNDCTIWETGFWTKW